MKKLLLICCVTTTATSLYAMNESSKPLVKNPNFIQEKKFELLEAIKNRKIRRVEQVLNEEVVNINEPLLPYQPFTQPIMVAVHQNASLEMLQLLFDHGATIGYEDNRPFDHAAKVHLEDELPFLHAAKSGNPRAIRWFLSHGANVNAKNESALSFVCSHDKQNQESNIRLAIKVLLCAGARFDLVTPIWQEELRKKVREAGSTMEQLIIEANRFKALQNGPRINQEGECPLCFETFKSLRLKDNRAILATTCCRQRFCEVCITTYHPSSCPLCRHKPFECYE